MMEIGSVGHGSAANAFLPQYFPAVAIAASIPKNGRRAINRKSRLRYF
ncbi:MAG: hypothetical protein ACLPKT_01810 [Methylocella sp.]